jgi:hypothetical protein
LLDGEPAPAGDPEPPQLAEGSGLLPTATPTPDAGEAVAQPARVVRRYDRARFSWKGGDPGTVDAQRGRSFVNLERLVDGEWLVVGTEEGPEDTTAFDQSEDVWTEIWQFGACDPLGTYRFRVTGRAVRSRGAAPEDYEAISETFELRRTLPLEIIDATVSGGVARVRARYPDPGVSLLALPRRVRDGQATISLAGGGEAVAEPDAEGLAFEAAVPEGAQIAGVRVVDRCGNST